MAQFIPKHIHNHHHLLSIDTNLIVIVGFPFLPLGMDGPTKTDEFLEKFQKGGGGSFPIQKFMLQILDI